MGGVRHHAGLRPLQRRRGARGESGGFGNIVTLGAFLGLLLGKPVGITLFVALAVASRVTRLPAGVGWAAIAGVGLVGGIGFTMALFIAMLAFGEGPALDQAKIGVLSASVCAAVVGYLLLRASLAPAAKPDGPGNDVGAGLPARGRLTPRP